MNQSDLKALARSRREQHLRDLRDGRRRVATRVPSGKVYNRKPKHRNQHG